MLLDECSDILTREIWNTEAHHDAFGKHNSGGVVAAPGTSPAREQLGSVGERSALARLDEALLQSQAFNFDWSKIFFPFDVDVLVELNGDIEDSRSAFGSVEIALSLLPLDLKLKRKQLIGAAYRQARQRAITRHATEAAASALIASATGSGARRAGAEQGILSGSAVGSSAGTANENGLQFPGASLRRLSQIGFGRSTTGLLPSRLGENAENFPQHSSSSTALGARSSAGPAAAGSMATASNASASGALLDERDARLHAATRSTSLLFATLGEPAARHSASGAPVFSSFPTRVNYKPPALTTARMETDSADIFAPRRIWLENELNKRNPEDFQLIHPVRYIVVAPPAAAASSVGDGLAQSVADSIVSACAAECDESLSNPQPQHQLNLSITPEKPTNPPTFTGQNLSGELADENNAPRPTNTPTLHDTDLNDWVQSSAWVQSSGVDGIGAVQLWCRAQRMGGVNPDNIATANTNTKTHDTLHGSRTPDEPQDLGGKSPTPEPNEDTAPDAGNGPTRELGDEFARAIPHGMAQSRESQISLAEALNVEGRRFALFTEQNVALIPDPLIFALLPPALRQECSFSLIGQLPFETKTGEGLQFCAKSGAIFGRISANQFASGSQLQVINDDAPLHKRRCLIRVIVCMKNDFIKTESLIVLEVRPPPAGTCRSAASMG